MKPTLEWKPVGECEWWVESLCLNGRVYDHTGDPHFDDDERFEICDGSSADHYEIFSNCESLEAAQLEVEGRIREAASPLFADMIAERDALKARVKELESQVSELSALCNEAAESAEAQGVVWPTELASKLRAVDPRCAIDPTGGTGA